MRFVLWSLVAVVTLLWTGGAWLVSSAASWLQEAASAGAGIDWASVASGLKLPAWVTWWFDPAWVLGAIDAAVNLLEVVWTAMPWLSAVVGWITPLTWIVWGVGAALFLLVGLVAHWGIGRLTRSKPANA